MENVTPQTKPSNNLVLAILSTLLCCMPLGIVAIVKAAQVDTLWAQNRYDEAVQSANDAKKWAMIGAAVAVAFWVIYLLFVVVAVIKAM